MNNKTLHKKVELQGVQAQSPYRISVCAGHLIDPSQIHRAIVYPALTFHLL